MHRYSSALDILASYIKGQKTIYMDDDDEIIEEKDEITFVKLGKRKKLI